MLKTVFVPLLAVSLTMGLPAIAQDVAIATARGEVLLPANPASVVVLDIAALDTLTALGVTPTGTPDRLYVDYLSSVPLAPVGTLFEPDLEALAMLAPDLIIAGGRSSTRIDALQPIAPTIDMTIWEDLPAESRARIAAYGTLFGKEDRAAAMVADLDKAFADATAAAAGKGKALILQTNGPKVSAFGKGSRFGWIHTALNLPEAFEALNPETHGDAVSFEFIAEVNPDWLIVIDRAAAIGEESSAAATLDNPLVAGTTAAKAGQIIYLPSAPIYIAGGGYTSMTSTLAALTAAFSK